MRTGVKIQRAMFLENLWRQMDKLSSKTGTSISKTARTYLAEGYEANEVVELLIDDGFDAVAAKECLASMSEDEVSSSAWGFEVEDVRGDIANNSDLGLERVAGADKGAAWEAAQQLVEGENPGQYRVIRVFAG